MYDDPVWPARSPGRVGGVCCGRGVVDVVTDGPAAAACPVCGVFSTSVRQQWYFRALCRKFDRVLARSNANPG